MQIPRAEVAKIHSHMGPVKRATNAGAYVGIVEEPSAFPLGIHTIGERPARLTQNIFRT